MKADALLVLKPDILSGPYAWCSGELARDTIRGVLAAYGDLQADPYEAPDSEGAVRWGLRNIARKVEARGWYTTHLEERGERLRSLRQLLRASDVADAEGLPTADLVMRVARALGFSLAVRRAWAFSRRDFLGLYAKNTHFTRLAGDLRCYLEGQPVEVLLLRGTQELTSLHILKEILRRVVRYPTTHYDAVENLLHVSDPGAADWEYFEGLLTAGAATERGSNMSTEPSGNESRPSVDRRPARNTTEAVNSEPRLRVHSLDANRVVRNGRNQYSLWPAEVAIPTGWSDQGVAGTREVCLAYIASAWVDMTSVPFADGAGLVGDVVPEPWVDARLSAARGARVPLPPASVHELIARTQQGDPGAVALRCAGKVVTRGELRTRTAQWSNALAGLGAIPGQPIAMLVPRSIEAVVAILAILESGSPYLPLSCDDPVERLLRILNDAGNPIVLADSEQAARLAEYRGTIAQIRQLDEAARWAAREPHPSRAGFDDLAYIMYTSGTTGAPKGVTGTHGQLVNYVRWCADEFALRPGECTVLLAPLHFLGSVMTVFTPLVAGWPIEIAPATSDIAGLLELIGRSGCGFLKVTPSHVRAMSGVGPMARIARQVMITSETLYMTPELSAWMSASPESRFANQYGMSETCGSTWWWVPAGVAVGERIPVGRPIFNAEAYIVGSDGELVPLGQPGELCVAGAVIGAGYQGQPSLTAERWLPNPWGAPGSRLLRTGDLARMDESGVVDIIGRADRQVKVRGHRVELPSIEEALRACPGLGDAVVLPATDRTPLELVAYLRPVAEPRPTVAELREHIARFLPEAAIPSRFVYLTSFPVTPNGKVDFARLPSCEGLPPPLASRHVAPGSATEATICRIFAEVLQVANVGALDNFFELGGDSLQVIEAATAIEESLSVEVSVVDLFDYPSSRALAAHLFAQTSPQEPS